VRENERAAAAAGVSVPHVKLQAFAISAFIAGVGGSLLAYQARVFSFERYTVFESLFVIVSAYIGGIGMVVGAVVAGTPVAGGILAKLLSEWGIGEEHRVIAGVGLLIAIQLHPDGLASTPALFRLHRRHKTARTRIEAEAAAPAVADDIAAAGGLAADEQTTPAGATKVPAT
jgi:branched-chain amino acid transport system permease protein